MIREESKNEAMEKSGRRSKEEAREVRGEGEKKVLWEHNGG